jgi:hypothetical protein
LSSKLMAFWRSTVSTDRFNILITSWNVSVMQGTMGLRLDLLEL